MDSLNAYEASRVVTLAQQAVSMVLKAAVHDHDLTHQWEGRTGVYLTFSYDRDPTPKLVIPVGTVPDLKARRFWTNSLEKDGRLAENPDHLSSWQTRNLQPEASEGAKYGGGIRSLLNLVRASASGFPEHGDEAIGALVLRGMSLITISEVERIIAISENKFLADLLASGA